MAYRRRSVFRRVRRVYRRYPRLRIRRVMRRRSY